MRLRKRIISSVLAACMAVTILPAGMPAKVSAAEETGETKIPEETEPGIVMPEFQEMPQILENETVPEWTDGEVSESGNVNEGIGLLADEETNKNRISCKYIPTGETSFSFTLYLPEEAVNEEDGYIVYLFDKDDKIAAKSVESEKVEYYDDKRFYFDGIYRTRELEAGEILYIGYSNGSGVINKLKDITVTVTDQPYVTNISCGDRKYVNSYYNNGYDGLYSGSDSASVVEVSGYNIDFSKLKLKLRDISTGEIVAASESHIEFQKTKSYYCIRWNDETKQYNQKDYDVEYDYTDSTKSVVNEEIAGTYYNYIDDFFNKRDENIIWNFRRDIVEYYNKRIPAGTIVSYEVLDSRNSQADICASGSSITVSDNHLVKINLKNKLPYMNGHEYKLIIRYEEDGQEKSYDEYFYAYKNDYRNLYWGIDGFYTTDDNEIDISAMIYPDEVIKNENRFTDICKVNIYNYKDDIVGEVELKLKKEGDRILYNGIYKGKLELGQYKFSISPDGEHMLEYAFYVYDKNKLYLSDQYNNIEFGEVILTFVTRKMAGWYYENPENLHKFKIKILDIEGNEIGIYKYLDGDFTIGNTGSNYISINFADKIKQELKNLYYCDVYFYYGDGSENDTTPKYYIWGTHNNETEYENFYENWHYNAYVRDKDIRWLHMGYKERYMYYYDYYYKETYNSLNGNSGAFPAKLTITDWYSLKPIKEITINEPLHVLTESELDGLSSDKLYNFFLKGADGSVNMSSGYIAAGNNIGEGDDEPAEPTPAPTPSNKPPISGGGIGSYIPSVNNGGSTVTQPTTEPTAAPEVSATPAPTVTPTNAPTAVPTTQPTAIPEPTNAPVQTAPPVDIQEPDNQITGNYTPGPEKKTKLELKKKKITLKKGQKAKIKITSELNTGVTYKSLKPSVATVSKKGVITAKKAGKAVITVKANGQVKKVEVTVKQAKKVEEKAVKNSSVKLGKDFKLAKSSVTLKKGGKLTIKKASGLSGKVTFRSLDKKIASVSVNGVVKAKKKGKTAILIKNGKKTIKLKIVVKK